MTIGLLGTALSPARRKALAGAGHKLVAPERAELRVHVGARPPVRPPKAPWIWCSPDAIAPADAAVAVLAGAYDVIVLDDQLPSILARRLGELLVTRTPGPPPVGFI